MDKIALNNKIVKMRHAVRKARVAVVSRLTKEIKILNGRKHGNESVIEKCRRKADRLIKEIKMLKKLKDDDITKYAITNEKDIKQVLSDLNVNIKSRIMIRLAFHKNLKCKIDEFREMFPDYRAYFELEKQTKGNNKKVTNKKSLEIITDEFKNEISDVVPIVTSDNDAEHVSYPDVELNCPDSAVAESNLTHIKTCKAVKKEKKKAGKTIKNETDDVKLIMTDPKLISSHSTIKVVSKVGTVRRFNVADDVMENIGTEEPTVNDTESDEDIMDDDGEIDLLSIVGKENNNSRKEISRSKSTNNQNEYNTTKEHYNGRNFITNIDNKYKRNSNFDRTVGKTRGKFTQSMNKQLDNNSNNNMKNSQLNNGKRQQINSEMNNGDLHPSWAARKKQQDIIKQGFQGKKIVFNDD